MTDNQKWLIIPDFSNLAESAELAEKYNAGFEYNDFCKLAVYSDPAETERRINAYLALDRDRSGDTLHGVFLDIAPAAEDITIRNYSRKLMKQSVDTAHRLGIRGVVFYTGLIGELCTQSYINANLNALETVYRTLCDKYPEQYIYLENTFEKTPDFFIKLKERMADVKNLKLCLDYTHASISATPPEDWAAAFAPYIGHIHINDNDLKNDLHSVPGDGKIDFMHFRRLIKKNGINLPMLLELDTVEKQKKAIVYINIQIKSEE